MFLHASRVLDYRTPFGAMPTDGSVQLFFDTSVDAENVTLCYTYGLYDFTYHEEPMCVADIKADHKRYRVDLTLPHEPGLLFYWFRFKLPASNPNFPHNFDGLMEFDFSTCFATLYYVAEGDTKNGEGKVYYEPPKVGADEEKYPYAWQITVYEKNFVTPDAMKGAMIYQIFPDRFARDKNFSFDKMVKSSYREERVYHEDWYEDVDIYGKPSTGYLACDFFGGSLEGIIEKLDYIKSLGIDIIYMNPICEARSSHRYDTADYLNVDPILGTNKTLKKLTKEAKSRGIRIIMDGVFSHTGADSKYFNKFDRYEGVGAYKSYISSLESNYRSWYNFYTDEEGKVTYDSWWGFPDLPNVNEDDLSYRKFIFGKDGVVDTWTKLGAGGIRLDVSDELPDGFIRQMRDTLKSYTKGEGILVGEVWEDASNKCSYGSYRDFMLGRTHDSVMGYTFRSTVLAFLNGHINAEVFNSQMEGFRERYPAESYYSIMNLISSHDVPRAYTLFSKPQDSESREEQKLFKVDESVQDECIKLARMAYAIQVGYIGACCLYYGDEILMEGYKDPFNRRTYPWGILTETQEDELKVIKDIAALRVNNPVLRTGLYETLLADGDAIAFRRYFDETDKDYFGKVIKDGSKEIILLINRFADAKTFEVLYNNVSLTEDDKLSETTSYIINSNNKEEMLKVKLAPNSFVFIIY